MAESFANGNLTGASPTANRDLQDSRTCRSS